MQEKTVLVVGGAGYIGSYVNKILHSNGFQTIVFDNLCRGQKSSVVRGDFFLGDLARPSDLDQVFEENTIDACLHFAAHLCVGESVKNPAKYYSNNVVNTINLLDAMLRHDVKKLVFSSSAAIFGLPVELPIKEDHPCQPINPYGRSKLMIEQILSDYSQSYGLRYCSLRYFNAAGADPDGEIKHPTEQQENLIPLAINSLIKNSLLTLFGNDYQTADGSCVRDYIHIHDLATAHVLALNHLFSGAQSDVFNLGNGQGFSVLEVIETINKCTGQQIKMRIGKRRPGDPPHLTANAEKAKKTLQWTPEYPKLESMIEHAWDGCHTFN